MNTYYKFYPNVWLAKCSEPHQKGEEIIIANRYGKENSHIVHNLIYERDGFYFYSITRADGFNSQERALRKAEKWNNAADNSVRRSEEYSEKSRKHADFLSLGEPIKVGHHSERRHRKMLEDSWNNVGKSVEAYRKADEQRSKAEYWEEKAGQINLSMPESVEYFEEQMKKLRQIHEDMKSGKIARAHSYSLTYAKKAANEAEKNYKIALKLWA